MKIITLQFPSIFKKIMKGNKEIYLNFRFNNDRILRLLRLTFLSFRNILSFCIRSSISSGLRGSVFSESFSQTWYSNDLWSFTRWFSHPQRQLQYPTSFAIFIMYPVITKIFPSLSNPFCISDSPLSFSNFITKESYWSNILFKLTPKKITNTSLDASTQMMIYLGY